MDVFSSPENLFMLWSFWSYFLLFFICRKGVFFQSVLVGGRGWKGFLHVFESEVLVFKVFWVTLLVICDKPFVPGFELCPQDPSLCASSRHSSLCIVAEGSSPFVGFPQKAILEQRWHPHPILDFLLVANTLAPFFGDFFWKWLDSYCFCTTHLDFMIRITKVCTLQRSAVQLFRSSEALFFFVVKKFSRLWTPYLFNTFDLCNPYMRMQNYTILAAFQFLQRTPFPELGFLSLLHFDVVSMPLPPQSVPSLSPPRTLQSPRFSPHPGWPDRAT